MWEGNNVENCVKVRYVWSDYDYECDENAGESQSLEYKNKLGAIS